MCGVIYVHVCTNAHVEARECQVSSLPYSFEIKTFTELGARGLQLKSLRSFHPYSTDRHAAIPSLYVGAESKLRSLYLCSECSYALSPL